MCTSCTPANRRSDLTRVLNALGVVISEPVEQVATRITLDHRFWEGLPERVPDSHPEWGVKPAAEVSKGVMRLRLAETLYALDATRLSELRQVWPQRLAPRG